MKIHNKSYDSNYLINLKSIFSSSKEQTLQLLDLNENDIVLDIGCGNGKDLIEISKYCNQAIGIDVDEKFISIAKEETRNISNINFHCCKANQIPIKSKIVDKVIADRFFQHIEEQEEVLAEIKRVLKPNGKFIIVDTDYFSISFFLEDLLLERQIVDTIGNNFFGSNKIRKIPDLLNNNNFVLEEIKINNFIINQYPNIVQILNIDKIIDKHINLLNDNRHKCFNLIKDEHFKMSLNLITYVSKNVL